MSKSNRKYSGLLIVGIFFFVFFCVLTWKVSYLLTPSNSQDETTNHGTRLYENKNFDFTIEYPEDWTKYDSSGIIYPVFVVFADGVTNTQTITVSAKQSDKPYDFISWINDPNISPELAKQGTKLEKLKQSTISGIPSIYEEITSEDMRMATYLFSKNGINFSISYVAPSTIFETGLNAAMKFFATFQIKEQ